MLKGPWNPRVPHIVKISQESASARFTKRILSKHLQRRARTLTWCWSSGANTCSTIVKSTWDGPMLSKRWISAWLGRFSGSEVCLYHTYCWVKTGGGASDLTNKESYALLLWKLVHLRRPNGSPKITILPGKEFSGSVTCLAANEVVALTRSVMCVVGWTTVSTLDCTDRLGRREDASKTKDSKSKKLRCIILSSF